MQYHPPNGNREVSNTNHIGSVSDRLGRHAVASEKMVSVLKRISKFKINVVVLLLLFL